MNRLPYFIAASIILVSFLAGSYASAKTLNIALILWRGETVAEKGFKEGLSELGYEVNYTIFNAEQKRSNLAGILRKEIQFEQFDYVYTFGTTVTKMVRQLIPATVPHVFNIVADPVKAGIVESWEGSNANVSGVSNAVPLELQIQNAHKVYSFKKLGVFFNPKESNSEIITKALIRKGMDIGFKVETFRSPPESGMLEKNLQGLMSETNGLDAVYFPADSYLISKAEYIGEQAKKLKVISIGSVGKYISKGVMLGTVADYYTLGKMVAGIIEKNQKGEKLAAIPVQMQDEPKLMINQSTVDKLGISIDPKLEERAVVVH